MFASGWETGEGAATGWEQQVAKFSKFSQPRPGSGPALGPGQTPGRAGDDCLLPAGRQLGAGTCQGCWKVGHGTPVHWLTVQATHTVQTRVTPYLHLQFIKSNC